MRILILQSELGRLRGGGENFTRNLFTAMAKRGHRIHAAFVADRHGQYPLPLPPGIEPLPVLGWWSRNLGQATLSSIGQGFPFRNGLRTKWDHIQDAFSWRTIRWHDCRFKKRVDLQFANRWDDFDAVYVHGSVDLAACIAKRRPTILRLPGPVTSEVEPLLRSVQAVCANGDALMCIKTFLGDHAIELPIGVDTDLFSPGPTLLRVPLGWNDRHFVIGYVGRLTRLKGVDLLASAFNELTKTAPDARLLIIGSGHEEGKIRSILANELATGVAYIKPDVSHDHLSQWYRAMDLIVMPSRYENFSNAVLEAMACGLPFLASDIGGNRMLAQTGAGWLFEPGCAASLARQLGAITRGRDEARTRDMIARDYMLQHFTWEATADRLESILTTQLGVKL